MKPLTITTVDRKTGHVKSVIRAGTSPVAVKDAVKSHFELIYKRMSGVPDSGNNAIEKTIAEIVKIITNDDNVHCYVDSKVVGEDVYHTITPKNGTPLMISEHVNTRIDVAEVSRNILFAMGGREQ